MTLIRRGFNDFNELKYSARAVPKTISKVGRVFPMVVVSLLPHEEFGPNDHRKDAPHVIHPNAISPVKIKVPPDISRWLLVSNKRNMLLVPFKLLNVKVINIVN